MTKLKFFGSSTSLTNFQNVKNHPMGPSNFEFYDIYLNITHGFSKLQVPKNQQCYHGAIFNPKSSQNWPKSAKIVVFHRKVNQVSLDSIFCSILHVNDQRHILSAIFDHLMEKYAKSMQMNSKIAKTLAKIAYFGALFSICPNIYFVRAFFLHFLHIITSIHYVIGEKSLLHRK